MKVNFKSIMIIFLVAVLGSSLGTIATSQILAQYGQKIKTSPSSSTITQVTYSNPVISDYSSAIARAYDAVVEIRCQTVSNSFFYGTVTGESAGSGVIISKDGYIVTNNHVVEGAKAVSVILSNGEEKPAELIGTDSRTDLAVIKIESGDYVTVSFADSEKVILGQPVIAIGNPLGEGITCSEGIISSLAKEILLNSVEMELLQTTAAVNEGNSGGGLFDLGGNIVGIVNAKSSSTASTTVEGMGYAIPANTAIRIVNDLIENGYVKNRATLGVKVYNSSSYYSTSEGLLISEVIKDGAADLAGLKDGDIIVSIDDYHISNYTDLAKTLDRYDIGDEVVVKVHRNSKELSFNLILQEANNNWVSKLDRGMPK